jgi:predicted nucleic-acid-binding protein
MLAIDTNLVVRYLTGVHPQQSAKAKAVIDGEEVFVSTTVMLETEWVLRSAHGFNAKRVCKALRSRSRHCRRQE